MASSNPDPQIGGVLPQQRALALELAFSHLPPDERRRQIDEALAQTPPPANGPFEGLLGAWRDGRLVGTVFSQIAPGKTAIVWLPRLAPGESDSTAAQLYAATWQLLARRNVCIAQVMLSTIDRVEAARLRMGGFRHLADLLYLVSHVDHCASCERSSKEIAGVFGQAPSPPAPLPQAGEGRDTCPLDFEPYCAAREEEWVRLFEATCRHTLDCPGLNDTRSPAAVLAGYRPAGMFDPELWLLVRHRRRAVGCVMLADDPRRNQMELLYLGLIPAARGRGWGRRLARRARWIAGRAGRRRLLAAVDAANTPAVQTYAAEGFQTWQRRRLYVRQLGPKNGDRSSLPRSGPSGASHKLDLSPFFGPIGTHRLNTFSTPTVAAAGETSPLRTARVEGFLR